MIVGSDCGGVSVGFTGGLLLEVLPVTTASDECWRYFRPGEDDDHFVVFEEGRAAMGRPPQDRADPVSYPESRRDPLPKDESYPINRGTLDAALAAAGVEHLDTIHFLRAGITGWRTASSGDVLRIDFRAATALLSPRVELRVHAVPASLKRTVAEAAVPSALSRACDWLRQAETRGNAWQSADHVLVVRWADGALVPATGNR